MLRIVTHPDRMPKNSLFSIRIEKHHHQPSQFTSNVDSKSCAKCSPCVFTVMKDNRHHDGTLLLTALWGENAQKLAQSQAM